MDELTLEELDRTVTAAADPWAHRMRHGSDHFDLAAMQESRGWQLLAQHLLCRREEILELLTRCSAAELAELQWEFRHLGKVLDLPEELRAKAQQGS